MKAAWAAEKLAVRMKSEIVEFQFTKADGTTRTAFGTLMPSVIPQTKGSRISHPTTQVFFDTVVGDWRSFTITNLTP